jgi:uncharacterized protein YgiM (DUF1202 family)
MRFILFLVLLLNSLLAVAQSAVVVDHVRANLRSEKSDKSRVIGVLPAASQVEVLQVDEDFAQVKTPDEKVGWVASRLLKINPQSVNKPAVDCPKELATITRQAAEEKARADKLQAQVQKQEESLASARNSLLTAAGIALLVGIALGIYLRERYYRKRLKGLRV